MDYTYQLSPYQQMIIRSDETWIPCDPANIDYQAYLRWVAEGNTPLPAGE